MASLLQKSISSWMPSKWDKFSFACITYHRLKNFDTSKILLRFGPDPSYFQIPSCLDQLIHQSIPHENVVPRRWMAGYWNRCAIKNRCSKENGPHHYKHRTLWFVRACNAVNLLYFVITYVCCFPQQINGLLKEIILGVLKDLRNSSLKE